MNNALSKIFVVKFYQLNAGFFLFIFLLFFGLVNIKDVINLHYAIMMQVTNKSFFTLIASSVCLLYTIKCLFSVLKTINLPENSFLYNLQGLNKFNIYKKFFFCQVSIYLPVLIYSLIVVYVGFVHNQILLSVFFFFIQVLLIISCVLIYSYRINSTWKQSILPEITLPAIKRKSLLMYLYYYSVNNRKATFFTIKVFSLLLLQLMVFVNSEQVSSENVCILLLFIMSAHSLLPYYYVRFFETELPFLRNLPISVFYRYILYVFTYSLILLPELVFLFWNELNVLGSSTLFSIYFFGIAQLALFTGLQYLKGVTIERYSTIVLGLFFVSMLLLAAIGLWYLLFVELLLSIFIFLAAYNKYEINTEQS